MTKNG